MKSYTKLIILVKEHFTAVLRTIYSIGKSYLFFSVIWKPCILGVKRYSGSKTNKAQCAHNDMTKNRYQRSESANTTFRWRRKNIVWTFSIEFMRYYEMGGLVECMVFVIFRTYRRGRVMGCTIVPVNFRGMFACLAACITAYTVLMSKQP